MMVATVMVVDLKAWKDECCSVLLMGLTSKLEEYLKNHHPSRDVEVNDAGKWSVMPQLPLSIPEKKKQKKQEMLIVMTQ